MDNNRYEITDSVESFTALLKRVRKAQEKFSHYSQEEVDRIFKAAATAAKTESTVLLAAAAWGIGLLKSSSICLTSFP